MRNLRGAFTLVEVLISMAIAMGLAALALDAFMQTSKTINRAESRLAMHAGAQSVYSVLHRGFSSTQQHCALVVFSTASTSVAPAPSNGTVGIIFMHGKEDTEDWRWYNASQPLYNPVNSDLLWEEWRWRGATSSLDSATSQPLRRYRIPGSYKPAGADFAGVNFDALPQPRRWLDPVTPFATLNDNIYFPDSVVNPTTSLAAPGQDVGDYQELQRSLTPALPGVTACSLQIVSHDGTITTVDTTTTTTRVFNGVWMDGRAQPDGSATYAGSDLAQRPALIRLRFTQTDPKLQFSERFHFTFALPGLSPYQ